MKSLLIISLIFASLTFCFGSHLVYTLKSSKWSTQPTRNVPVAIPNLSKKLTITKKSTIVVKIFGHAHSIRQNRRVDVVVACDGKMPGVGLKRSQWKNLNSFTYGVGLSHTPNWLPLESIAIMELNPGNHRVYGVVKNAGNNGKVHFNGAGMIIEVYEGEPLKHIFDIGYASPWSAIGFNNMLVEIQGTQKTIHVDKPSKVKILVHAHMHAYGNKGRVDLLISVNKKLVGANGHLYPVTQKSVFTDTIFPPGSALSNNLAGQWVPVVAVATVTLPKGTHHVKAMVRNAVKTTNSAVAVNGAVLIAETFSTTNVHVLEGIQASVATVIAQNNYPVEVEGLEKFIHLSNPSWVKVIVQGHIWVAKIAVPIDIFICVDDYKVGIAQKQKINVLNGLISGMGISHVNRWIPGLVETAVLLQPGRHRIHAVIRSRTTGQSVTRLHLPVMIVEELDQA